MISLNWLPETAFLFLLIFARVGTILMLMPALGEMMIPSRIKLSFGLALTLVLFPVLSPTCRGFRRCAAGGGAADP
jgi:flagellar biosynthetic protein FliR